jgi:hypothetical protein
MGRTAVKLDSIEGLQLVFAFLLPGFVASWVLSAFTARKSLAGEAALLRYLALSTINFAICYWPLRAAGIRSDSEAGWLFWGVTLVLSPSVLALLFAANNQFGWSQKLLGLVGLKMMHATDSAWDYAFSRWGRDRWLIVTLKNEKIVAGLTGKDSFASSISEERDLFIQEMWRYDCDTNTITALDKPRSILICRDEISTVEFSD